MTTENEEGICLSCLVLSYDLSLDYSQHGILANVVDALLTYSLKPATLLLYIDVVVTGASSAV